jgi:SNF2 family DNA or RNA helicase
MFFDSPTKSKAFRKLTHPVSGDSLEFSMDSLRLPAVLDVESRPYQIEGAGWLHNQKRAILGDDAGLGKTVQAAMAAVRPVLITCPSYVVLQWEAFLKENYPNDTVSVAGIGNRQQRHRGLVPGGDHRKLVGPAPADWCIVSTDMHRGYYLPDATTWICDEAHHFRNREAERSKLAFEYAKRVERLYMLTATPVYKDVTNLWHLLHMLAPKEWSSYWDFFQDYAKTGGGQGWAANKVVGIWNPKRLERELIPYLLRRTYKDVGLFLPDIIDKDVILEFSPEMRKLYKGVKEQFVYEDIPLTSQSEVMHTLRRCTVLPKIDAAKEILEDSPDEPTVCFTWYRDTAEDLANEVGGLWIDVEGTGRAAAVNKALDQVKVVVCTIGSLSEGIDLSRVKQVIQLEEDYVPGSMYQERRRFARWTKDQRPVIMHNLRIRNTIDIDVHHAVATRRGSAQQILKEALL